MIRKSNFLLPRYLVTVGFIAASAMANAGQDSGLSDAPVVDALHVAIRKGDGKSDHLFESLPNGMFKRCIDILNIPAGVPVGDSAKAFEKGVFGCGRDRFDPRSFGEASYAQHLKRTENVCGNIMKCEGWRVLAKNLTTSNWVFGAWRMVGDACLGKGCFLWTERQFCAEGMALRAFHVRTFPIALKNKLRSEMERSEVELMNWEREIRRSLSDKKNVVGQIAGLVARSSATAEDYEILPDVWIPVPDSKYLRMDPSNRLWTAVARMTSDKFLASTLVCYFPTNRESDGSLFDSEIGLPAVRQLHDAEKKVMKKRNHQMHLKSLADNVSRMGKTDFRVNMFGFDKDKWTEIDRFRRENSFRFSACIDAEEGFKAVLSQRHFFLNGHALYLSLRKDFKKGDSVDVRHIAQLQSGLLENWEAKILGHPKNIGENGKSGSREYAGADRYASKPFGQVATSEERTRDLHEDVMMQRKAYDDARAEIERKRSEAIDRKFHRVVILFAIILVAGAVFAIDKIVFALVKRRTDSHLRKVAPPDPSLDLSAKCYFCGRAVPQEYNVTVTLHGNHEDVFDTHRWQESSISIPCCAICLAAARKEKCKTWRFRLAVVIPVYIACVAAMASVIRSETLGLAITAGCIISIIPASITLAIVANLKPMPFWLACRKKIHENPMVSALIAAGFQMHSRFKISIPLTDAVSILKK